MTKLLPEHCTQRCRLLLAGLVLALAACGPGSGGTGTGPTVSYSSVNAGGANPGSPSVPTGGSASDGSCAVSCGPVDLLLQAGSVEAITGCGRFVSTALWEADASGQAVVLGTLETLSGSGAAATLLLQFSGTPETSQTVTVTLSAADGKTVLGPSLLGRVDELAPRTPAGACPS